MASSNNLVLPSVDNEYVSQFCRACACKLRNSPCKIENNPEKPELHLLLKRYVPEFDVKVGNACLCVECISILYVFHNFKRKCMRTEETLRLHIRQHPEVKTVDLNDVFGPEKSENTVISATTALHNCEVCGKGFAEKNVLTDHMIVKHGEGLSFKVKRRNFNCKICNRTFVYKTSLQKHMEHYHKRERYQCNKCSRNFIFKNLYDEHIEYHKRTYANRYVCKICNFVYPSHSSLYKHNISKHKGEEQRPFGCSICAKRFVERNTLNIHMLIHTGEKPFKCKMCPYVARQQNLLNRHMRLKHSNSATAVKDSELGKLLSKSS